MSSGRFDVIIVGAGPAGLTAGYVLARNGVRVLILERGEYPGAKNTFGGALYPAIFRRHLPELIEDMPVERAIHRYVFGITSGSSYGCVEIAADPEPGAEPAFTVLRSRFDRWLAGKARAAGAKILCATLARDLIFRNGAVAGVQAEGPGGEIEAPIVVLAEGVNGWIGRRQGLGPALKPGQISIGVKENLKLSEQTIDERFHGWGGRGSTYQMVGTSLGQRAGGGFLYTNRDTLSLGIVVQLEDIRRSGRDVARLLAEFKNSDPIRDLIRGASPREYCAHLIPEAGVEMQPSLTGDGILIAGDAAGFVINAGYKIRGADLAVASGLAAAQTVRDALNDSDFSRQRLDAYAENLAGYHVSGDLHRFRKAPEFFKNTRLYGEYPDLACAVLNRLMTVSGDPQQGLWTVIREEIGNRSAWKNILMDGIRALRSI